MLGQLARWFYPFESGAHCNNYYYLFLRPGTTHEGHLCNMALSRQDFLQHGAAGLCAYPAKHRGLRRHGPARCQLVEGSTERNLCMYMQWAMAVLVEKGTPAATAVSCRPNISSALCRGGNFGAEQELTTHGGRVHVVTFQYCFACAAPVTVSS